MNCLHLCNLKLRRRQWQPTPVLLPGKSHGRRSLVGCSPWGGWELDTTERLQLHFSLSCTGEGNGNPLHCSCLENPRDGGSWWAAVYGVAQSRPWLKRLSSTHRMLNSLTWYLIFAVQTACSLCCKLVYSLIPPPASLEQFSQSYWDAVSHAWSCKYSHQVK